MKDSKNKKEQVTGNKKAQTDTSKNVSPSKHAIKKTNEEANDKKTKADKVERNTNVDQE